MKIVASSNRRAVASLLSPQRVRDASTDARVATIVADVRRSGDRALARYARDLDGWSEVGIRRQRVCAAHPQAHRSRRRALLDGDRQRAVGPRAQQLGLGDGHGGAEQRPQRRGEVQVRMPQPRPEQRSGIGSLIDSVFGPNCFRVGDRAPSNLYGVPSQYRGTYRDNGSIYYRSDGRAVYGIDARTNTVVSVNPLR
jgi:hypothetical protein